MSFDTQLKDRLESAASHMPGEPLDLKTTLRVARRSRSMHVIAAAGTAAALVAGVVTGMVMVGSPRDDSETGMFAAEPRLAPTKQEQAVFAVVDEFFVAVNRSGERNRAEAMWRFFSPVSRAHFGDDVDNFDPVDFNGETMGAWEFAGDRRMRLQFLDEEETVGAVTVTGKVSREGFVEEDAIAIPVRMADGKATIELFSDASYPVPSRPDIASAKVSTLPRDTTLSVRVGRSTSRIAFLVSEWSSYDSVWRGETALFSGGEPTAAPRREYSVDLAEHPLEPGRYVATFLVASKSGGLAAAAEPFVVE